MMLSDENRTIADKWAGDDTRVDSWVFGAELLNSLMDEVRQADTSRGMAVLRRVGDVLAWLDERGRNSASYGSHADAYEIAARRLREALAVEPEASENAPVSEPDQSACEASDAALRSDDRLEAKKPNQFNPKGEDKP